MNILVTAGNTLAPIDRVRCLTNVFTGRTGAAIALAAHKRGHAVILLTSHPDAAADLHDGALPAERFSLCRYRTYDELRDEMAGLIRGGGPDAVIHAAAVSDYLVGGVYAADGQTHFRPDEAVWEATPPAKPTLTDRAAGKVKSDEPELWLRLVRAPKLVDFVRADWGFNGLLVKFKLEVDVTDDELLTVAEQSRVHSRADFMVANTLDGAAAHAFIGPIDNGYQKVPRRELAGRLLELLEKRNPSPSDG